MPFFMVTLLQEMYVIWDCGLWPATEMVVSQCDSSVTRGLFIETGPVIAALLRPGTTELLLSGFAGGGEQAAEFAALAEFAVNLELGFV